MLKIIALGAAVLVGGVLVAAAFRPDTFRVERSATIQAAPEKVFPLINDLQRFNAWNPFKDPNGRLTYSGAPSGVGAAFAFDGGQSGSGRLGIVESVAASEVRMTLDMVKPLQAQNIVQFTLRPEAGGTRVTWAMQGGVPYVAKILHLFCDVDAMVGGEFDKGLAGLKKLAES